MVFHSISLCTGLAGIELGIELACPRTFEPVLYVEREAGVAEILAARIEEGSLHAAPIWSDVKTVCCRRVREYVRRRLRRANDTDDKGIGLLTAGYPCQPFSVAGKRRGRDDPRHLWPFIVDAIDCYRPAICFFENVAGHLRLGFGTVRRNLEERGFAVQAGLFSATEIGAPHQRLRLFILVVDDSQDVTRSIHAGQRRQQLGATDTGRSIAELADSRRGLNEQSRISGDVRGSTGGIGGEASEWEWCWNAVGDERTAMADASIGGRGELRQPSPGERQLDRRDERMGDTASRASDVANGHTADVGRRQPIAWPGYRQLSDAEVIRHEERPSVTDDAREEFTATDRDCLPVWPPSRNDADGWRYVLDRWPELAPAITETEAESYFRGKPHGIPDEFIRGRIHDWNARLRALGNAVVPECAATAFVQLLARHHAKQNQSNQSSQ